MAEGFTVMGAQTGGVPTEGRVSGDSSVEFFPVLFLLRFFDRPEPVRCVGVDGLSDEELVQRTASGEAAAYRELSNRYLKRVFEFTSRLCRSEEEAEEVTQETFLRLWLQAHRYKPRAKLITWLFRIARNLVIDQSRRRREQSSAKAEEAAADSQQPGLLLERKQVAQAVAAGLASLPEPQRAAVVLSHYEGLSGEEAAAVLGVSVRAFESRLARGRNQLRELLSAMNTSPQTGVSR